MASDQMASNQMAPDEMGLDEVDLQTEDSSPAPVFIGSRDAITGQALLMTEDDDRAYYNFCHKYVQEFQPKTFNEEQLVRTIADTQWRLNRTRAVENNLVSFHISQSSGEIPSTSAKGQAALTQAQCFGKLTRDLDRMSSYEQRLQKTLDKTYDRLERVQNERRARERESLCMAAAVRRMKQAQKQTWTPPDDGFDHTLAEIDAHLRKTTIIRQAMSFTARR